MPTKYKAFASKSTVGKYIGVNCVSEVCAPVQLVEPGTVKTELGEYNILERVISNLGMTPELAGSSFGWT